MLGATPGPGAPDRGAPARRQPGHVQPGPRHLRADRERQYRQGHVPGDSGRARVLRLVPAHVRRAEGHPLPGAVRDRPGARPNPTLCSDPIPHMFLMPNMRKGIRCLAPCANDQARAHPVAAAGLVFGAQMVLPALAQAPALGLMAGWVCWGRVRVCTLAPLAAWAWSRRPAPARRPCPRAAHAYIGYG